jgi:beta-galactosidase
VDKHNASTHGVYSSAVSQMQEDYIRPQENGSHFDCDYVVVKGIKKCLAAVSDKPFCFNASVFTEEELTEKTHNYELVPCGSTVLCLDYKQNGIGSESCGPRLLKKYRLDDGEFTFTMKLIPSIE